MSFAHCAGLYNSECREHQFGYHLNDALHKQHPTYNSIGVQCHMHIVWGCDTWLSCCIFRATLSSYWTWIVIYWAFTTDSLGWQAAQLLSIHQGSPSGNKSAFSLLLAFPLSFFFVTLDRRNKKNHYQLSWVHLKRCKEWWIVME